jgi:hypothetical protein
MFCKTLWKNSANYELNQLFQNNLLWINENLLYMKSLLQLL